VVGRWDLMELLEEGKSPPHGYEKGDGLMVVHLFERLKIELHRESLG